MMNLFGLAGNGKRKRDTYSNNGSIKNTQKITKAMEMVAASKMRKAQDRMQLGKPYAQRIRSVCWSHMPSANPEYKHLFMQEREVKRVGFIIGFFRSWFVWWFEHKLCSKPPCRA